MEGTRWKFGKWKEGACRRLGGGFNLLRSRGYNVTTICNITTDRYVQSDRVQILYMYIRLIDIHTITSSDLQQPMTGQSFSPYLYDARHAGLGEVESNR